MNVSTNELRKQTVAILRQVDAAIESVTAEALSHGIEPTDLRDSRGDWVILPLLTAKAQCLNTLVLLNEPRK